MSLRLLALLLLALLCLGGAKKKKKASKEGEEAGWKEKTNEQGKVVQELKIEAPSMTEEDQYGYTMPDRYKCDSCRAVMFHLDAGLKKIHPKSRRMKQWEYTDAFDDACRNSFEGYGVKLLNGENTLSGPGLVHKESLAPGSGAIQMGGETWTKRLSEACRKIIYDRMGEDELYDKYREDGGLTEAICFSDLRDCSEGPAVPPKPKEAPPAEKPKAEKKKPKKDKKEDKVKITKEPKASTATPPKSAVEASSGGDRPMDSQTFLRNMAVRHGLTAEEYLMARTEREWEKLTIAMAGRIFNRLADSEPNESCRANAFGR